ncbi:proton-conducting transporter membrane subunit [Dyadobacter sp. 676]|uniref:Proton-conducting transporter membrane subunit n=1 Tax=Dyadobacter sp. 676 TaxID=3088362 RepID=A0AAU8FT86_9BACT
MPDTAYLLPAYLLLGLPFSCFLLLWLGGKSLNKSAGWIGVLCTAVGLVVSVINADPGSDHFIRFQWVTIGSHSVELSFRFDTLSVLMLVIVHFVALLVQLFSTAYMHDDRNVNRYFAFIQLFLFSMLGIVLAGSLLVMYIFWELVGLSSYLLIGFWYTKKAPRLGSAEGICAQPHRRCRFSDGYFNALLLYWFYGF